MAIVNRHRLALPPHHHGLPGVSSGFYSKYGIAQSLVEIPLYVLGQHLAARVVVVGELAGNRLDLDVVQALSIEQPPGEGQRIQVDAGVDLRPFRVRAPHPIRGPASDKHARQQHEQDVDPKVHLGTSTSWREVRRV